MNAPIPRHYSRFPSLAISLVIALFLVSACASNSPAVLSKLDPRTSVTISYNQSPLVFFRTLSPSSAKNAEHVYLAPLEVNRSGDYRYYLWSATWSTLDRTQPRQLHERIESIEIVADGQPVTLKIKGGSSQAIGASEPVYRKPVAWATEAYYDVSLDQLRRIAEATDLRVQYSLTRETFEPWNDQKSSKAGLIEFLAHSEY